MIVRILFNGKLIVVNLSKVCAITDEYIQFDGGNVIYGTIDMDYIFTMHNRNQVIWQKGEREDEID